MSIRMNLIVEPEDVPLLFADLNPIPQKRRAARARHLMNLGLLAEKGLLRPGSIGAEPGQTGSLADDLGQPSEPPAQEVSGAAQALVGGGIEF